MLRRRVTESIVAPAGILPATSKAEEVLAHAVAQRAIYAFVERVVLDRADQDELSVRACGMKMPGHNECNENNSH
jgi:hypothetical protein